MRYEIRKGRLSGQAKGVVCGVKRCAWIVWDVELDKPVAFGRHTSQEAAEQHIDRLKRAH